MTAAAGDLSSRAGGAKSLPVSPWLIAIVVSMATFMEVLDTSIANVALPHIAGGLSAGAGRVDVGADQLPRLQRHRTAHQRLARFHHRAQAVFTWDASRSLPSVRSYVDSRQILSC